MQSLMLFARMSKQQRNDQMLTQISFSILRIATRVLKQLIPEREKAFLVDLDASRETIRVLERQIAGNLKLIQAFVSK